jgi:hypothetical protein
MVWARPATRRRDGRRILHRGGLDLLCELRSKVGLARPTNQVVDGPLGAVLAARAALTDPCGDLGATRP